LQLTMMTPCAVDTLNTVDTDDNLCS